MRSIRIAGAGDIPIGAPADWSEETHGHCSALFVRHEDINGVHWMRSGYEVDHREAAMLLAGAQFTLGIACRTHPVVQLAVGDLPSHFEPVVTARRFTQPDGRPFVRVEMLFPPGNRVYVEVHVAADLSDSVALGITMLEQFARSKGWAKAPPQEKPE